MKLTTRIWTYVRIFSEANSERLVDRLAEDVVATKYLESHMRRVDAL